MNKKFYWLLLTLYVLPLFGAVEYVIDYAEFIKGAALGRLHVTRKDSSIILALPSKPALLVASFELFGQKRFFTFETKDDAQDLFAVAKASRSKWVDWYYLKKDTDPKSPRIIEHSYRNLSA